MFSFLSDLAKKTPLSRQFRRTNRHENAGICPGSSGFLDLPVPGRNSIRRNARDRETSRLADVFFHLLVFRWCLRKDKMPTQLYAILVQ